MSQRVSYHEVAPEALVPLYQLGNYFSSKTSLEPSVRRLAELRASQLNGCAFCIAMHWREAEAAGVDGDRLHGLPAWRETSWYSPRERAALAWTEAITLIGAATALDESAVSDAVYEQARAVFSEREIVDLTFVVATTNVWNRLNVAFRTPPERAAEVLTQLRMSVGGATATGSRASNDVAS